MSNSEDQRIKGLYRKRVSINKIARLCNKSPEWIINRLNELDVLGRLHTGSGKNMAYGYTRIYIDGKWILEHRYIWEQANGPLPHGWIVHHLNGIKTDNRIENLLGMPRTEHGTIYLLQAKDNQILELENKVNELNELINAYEKCFCVG